MKIFKCAQCVNITVGCILLALHTTVCLYAQQPSEKQRKPKEDVSENDLPSDTATARMAVEFRGLQPMLQVPRVLEEVRDAERSSQWSFAAQRLVWAITATRSYALRDTLKTKLQTFARRGAFGPMNAENAQRAIERALDSTFQAMYDRRFAVERYTGGMSQKTVLAEYLTGTQCSVCWEHDRVFAGLLQRYSPDQLVVIGYHDGPGYPIARPSDSLNTYIGGAGDSLKRGMYQYSDTAGAKFNEWIDGVAYGAFWNELKVPIAEKYKKLATAIDHRLQDSPAASVHLTLKPVYDRRGRASSVYVSAQVRTVAPRGRIGVRLVLVQDTVRVTGYTPRRLQYMAARTVAWFAPRKMFFTLPADGTTSVVTYTFDIAALQSEIYRSIDHSERNSEFDDQFRTDFPARSDWTIDRSRLGVVAIVQDQETLEVLQATYRPLKGAPQKGISSITLRSVASQHAF